MPRDKGQAEDAEEAKKAEERAQAAEGLRARVGDQIRALAKRRKIRLVDLAEQAGVSRGHLWGILNGESAATTDYLCRIAKILRVDPHELMRPLKKPTGQ